MTPATHTGQKSRGGVGTPSEEQLCFMQQVLEYRFGATLRELEHRGGLSWHGPGYTSRLKGLIRLTLRTRSDLLIVLAGACKARSAWDLHPAWDLHQGRFGAEVSSGHRHARPADLEGVQVQ